MGENINKGYNNLILKYIIMEKIKVSQDFLYDYLTEHNFTISSLGDLMGVSDSVVRACFLHTPNRHGKPQKFSASNIQRLNEALEQVANELRGCLLTFGSNQTYTNLHGSTYDPALVEQIKNGMNKYFKLRGLLNRILGWNVTKCRTTLSIIKSPVYGNITRDDADRINAELLAVAGVLSSYEVVPDESHTPTIPKGESTCETADSKQHEKGLRKRMEQFFESPSYPWDDTSLHLQERNRLFREQYAQGLLLFRVNGGYTAEGDDARLVSEIDSSIHPYTDTTSGMTTAYMDSEQMSNILPRLIAQDRHVMFTDMYDKQ